jgi:uncharacterized protein YvpB
MMHTFTWRGEDDQPQVVINHNGGYSGDAHVSVCHPDNPNLTMHTITLPAEALVNFAKQAVGEQLATLLEENGFM